MLMLPIIYNSSSGEDGILPQDQQNNHPYDRGAGCAVVPAGCRLAGVRPRACWSAGEGDGDHMAQGR